MPEFLLRHPWLTFFLMGASFAVRLTSVNPYTQLAANISLFVEYGTMVIADGALQQLPNSGSLLCASSFTAVSRCAIGLVRA